MKKINLVLGLFLVGLITGCYNEDEISPTEEPEAIYGRYTLPQGNHDYDPKIEEIYKAYGTLLLYKFEDKDYWWNVLSDIRWSYNPSAGVIPGYEAAPADENYVGEQIGLLQEKFFKYFPDTLLRRTLPLKMLLSSYFNYVPSGDVYPPAEESKRFLNAYWGYDYIGVNWGNEKIRTMTPEQKNRFKADLCALFLTNSANKKMSRSVAFFAISDYSSSGSSTPDKGFVESEIGSNLSADWSSYIRMIVSTPYSKLTGDEGFLNPVVDTEGKIRKKYDIITDFFKNTYHIDLQAIGDDVE